MTEKQVAIEEVLEMLAWVADDAPFSIDVKKPLRQQIQDVVSRCLREYGYEIGREEVRNLL